MDFSKPEVDAVIDATLPFEQPVIELNELQLALVGGGTGETSLG